MSRVITRSGHNYSIFLGNHAAEKIARHYFDVFCFIVKDNVNLLFHDVYDIINNYNVMILILLILNYLKLLIKNKIDHPVRSVLSIPRSLVPP